MPSLTSHTVYDAPARKQTPKSSTTSEASEAPAPTSTKQQAPILSNAEAVTYLDAAVLRVDVQLARLVESVVGAMEVWEWYAFGGEEVGGEGEEGAGC